MHGYVKVRPRQWGTCGCSRGTSIRAVHRRTRCWHLDKPWLLLQVAGPHPVLTAQPNRRINTVTAARCGSAAQASTPLADRPTARSLLDTRERIHSQCSRV
jgi:hypothetical protein